MRNPNRESPLNSSIEENITSAIEKYTIGNTRCKYYTLINIVLKAILHAKFCKYKPCEIFESWNPHNLKIF